MKLPCKNILAFLLIGFTFSCDTSENIIPRHESFIKLYGNDGDQFGVEIKQLDNNDMVILAHVGNLLTTNFMLIRIDTLGNEVWLKEFGNGREGISLIPEAMVIDNDQNIIVCGTYTSGLESDVFIYKISPSGELLLSNENINIGENKSNEIIKTNDIAQDIISFENNSFVISGYTRVEETAENEFFSIRVDGTTLEPYENWNRIIPYLDDNTNIPFSRETNRILPFGESKIITFTTSELKDSDAKEGTNIEISFLNNEGNAEYTPPHQERSFSGTDQNDEINNATQIMDGYAFIGTSNSNITSSIIVGRLNSSGTKMENEFIIDGLNKTRNLKGADIDQMENGGLFILAEETVTSDNVNLYMAEINSFNGSIIWELSYGGEDIDEAAAIIVNKQSIYILGTLKLNSQNKVLLIKTNEKGRL